MQVKFLLDENLSPHLKTWLLNYDAAIDVVRVGDEGAPPLGTLDPDILRYAEQSQRILVTNNRESIPSHVADHWLTGGQHWGILHVRTRATTAQIIDALYEVWAISEAEEWHNIEDWIPFG
jgi:predicted nuclease of predicted toxin-antitoxin system